MPIQGDEANAPAAPLQILIPLFNDWDSFARLAGRLDRVLAEAALKAHVLVVDDGSIVEPDRAWGSRSYQALQSIEVLKLRRNLGHQRAIAVGLAYLHARARTSLQAVVVMDGDGEDAPEDVPRLLARLTLEGGRSIVFAERTRRSESLGFRFFYFLYRQLHWVLTSERVRVGNFSAIPRSRLESLVAVSELWNHYAAAVFHSRQPFCTIPTQRADRLGGRSSMNFVALVTHGLSAISVFREIIGVRLLVMSVILALLAIAGLASTAFLRLFTTLVIPGWALITASLLLIVLLQAIMMSFVFCFVILGVRNATTFLPLRDYPHFIQGTWMLDPLSTSSAVREGD